MEYDNKTAFLKATKCHKSELTTIRRYSITATEQATLNPTTTRITIWCTRRVCASIRFNESANRNTRFYPSNRINTAAKSIVNNTFVLNFSNREDYFKKHNDEDRKTKPSALTTVDHFGCV